MFYTLIFKLPNQNNIEELIHDIYSNYSNFLHPTKSKSYLNIPHITLTPIGDDKYSKETREIIIKNIKNFQPFEVEIETADSFVDYKENKYAHVIFKIKPSEMLNKIHSQIYLELEDKIKYNKFALDKYNPHISLITKIDSDKVDEIIDFVKDKLTNKKILISTIAVKEMDGVNKAKIVEEFELDMN